MPQLPSHMARAAKEFSTIRRQQFMYWEAYEAILERLDDYCEKRSSYCATLTSDEKLDLAYVADMGGTTRDALNRISLEYTAGAPIEELKALYPAAVDAFEAWCKADDDWYVNRHPEKRGQILNSPVEFEDPSAYLELLRLLSMGVLFGEGDQIRRIAKLIAAHRQLEPDTIVEELLLPFVPDGKQIDALFHIELYDPLVGAAWEEGEESSRCMTKFLGSWYKFFEGAPWHNAHMRIGENEEHPDWANYYGYFAWEAGAIAYLYKLDDSTYRDHILYPKDLVDWARQQGPVPVQYTPPAPEQSQSLSAQPGSICPKEGVWFAPHLQMKELHMKQGERFPSEAYGPTGAVTWYFKR